MGVLRSRIEQLPRGARTGQRPIAREPQRRVTTLIDGATVGYYEHPDRLQTVSTHAERKVRRCCSRLL